MLTLKVGEKALVRLPDWDQIAGLRAGNASIVAIDLADVDFISSLFLQGCVELSRSLAARGAHVVLLHLSPSQRSLLQMVDGASGLVVADDEEQLKVALQSVTRASGSDPGTEGVTRAEKNALWR